MQRFRLTQNQQQRLSPQQIQFMKLLQVTSAELETSIQTELENNPVLEEGLEIDEDTDVDVSDDDDQTSDEEKEKEAEIESEIEDYLQDDDEYSYKTQNLGNKTEEQDAPVVGTTSLHENLNVQLGFLGLNKKQLTIGKQLIGSIGGDGYIRRDIAAIVNDLAFTQEIETNLEEVMEVLRQIQSFDPPGIGARNLQECLLIQLDRMNKNHNIDVFVAKQIITNCYDEFTKKHFSKILKKLDLSDEEFVKDAIELILKLNPKPGGESNVGMVKNQFIIPDFILHNNNGKLELTLNSRNAPELRISRTYSEMLRAYSKGSKKDKKLKETVSFVKHKLDSARWFIDAIKQRQQTLLQTMQVIIDFQFDFFISGDEMKLKPMILKDIADRINMDISTVSRVASSKSIQTDFGIYLLKYFFSEGIAMDSGEEVSSREVKNVIQELIQNEDKESPYSDDKIEELLNKRGYNIARRTVAKYREQLNISVARLRKQL